MLRDATSWDESLLLDLRNVVAADEPGTIDGLQNSHHRFLSRAFSRVEDETASSACTSNHDSASGALSAGDV